MSLGEKLRAARLEAGLSQRELCGDTITRNMLSQIEHGTAKPSMGTLQNLAARLGRPVSFFLEEDVPLSPNKALMEKARAGFEAGDWAGVLDVLKDYSAPDEIFDREKALLNALARLSWAEKLLGDGREPYAREILLDTETEGIYCAKELTRRKLLLLTRLGGMAPGMDEELLLRAEAALRAGDPSKAGHLLDAADHRLSPRWNLLRGRAACALGDYAPAVELLKKAEPAYPEACAPELEECYRELGNFRLAYAYACKRRKG